MIYSIQLYTEQRSARKYPFSAERVLLSTVKCGELRANGNPVAYAMRENARFSAKNLRQSDFGRKTCIFEMEAS